MRAMLGILRWCLLIYFWFPGNAWATDFLNLDVPARGDALAAGAADDHGSDSLNRNPAGLFGQTQPSLSFTHFIAFEEFTYEQLEGFYPDGLSGNWAVRLLYATSAPFPELDQNGQEAGMLNYHDLLLHLAYARKFNSLQAGLAVKLFESQLADRHSRGAALDAGLRYQTPWQPLAFGLAVQNLGGRSAFLSTRDSLPQQALAGLSVFCPTLPGQDVTLFADYVEPLLSGENGRPAVGLEYGLYQAFFLRAGYRLENELGSVSLGAGIRLAGWGLDYAYQPFAYLGTSHHVTLTYAFAQEKSADRKVNVRDLPADQPADGPRDLAVVAKPAETARIKELTVLPRNYESSLVYKTPVLASRVREWTFEIRDESGRTIKTLAGHTKPPAYIQWDGRNQAGQSVPQNTRYQFVFSTSAQKAEVKTLPAFQPVLKFRFENGVTPLLSVRFRLKTRPLVKQWSLEIREGQSGRTVQTIAGRGELPESLLWDGRDENKKTADTRLAYQYLLTVTYPDESQLSLAGRIVPILARPVEAPSGQTEILIPGILFDFNSALLRPEMTDKIMAAAGILEELQAATRVTCEGHADEIGGVAYNQKLSLTRAQMVAQFMAKQPGVRASVIEAKGFGKLKPENQLNTEAGRERNRRVEIRLFIPKSAQ